MKICQMDVNFKKAVLPNNINIEYYDSKNEPFTIFGLLKENGQFRRMPEDIAKSASAEVEWASKSTAGGRLCFKTNSQYISIIAKVEDTSRFGQQTTLGGEGFDLYVEDEFRAAFIPDRDFDGCYNCVANLGDKDVKNITMNFPIYSKISELYIGVEKLSFVDKYNPYINISPIVYYGSSITQGGCASRPGNIYENEIARRTGVDYINLGLSGSALGEEVIAEYISKLHMSIFVMDYDHNSPNAEFLKKTHNRFFKIIRSKNPELPILLLSRPNFMNTEEDIERRDAVYSTYINARRNGDNNVYFIDGDSLFGDVPASFCTVDRCHPNDMGFYCMASRIGNVIKNIVMKLK